MVFDICHIPALRTDEGVDLEPVSAGALQEIEQCIDRLDPGHALHRLGEDPVNRIAQDRHARQMLRYEEIVEANDRVARITDVKRPLDRCSAIFWGRG